MKLYDSSPTNHGTRKIRALAKEVDIRLEHVAVDLRAGEGQKPEYLKLNPNGKIPTLVDGDFKLFESNAILCFLAATAKRTDLLPTEPRARAHVDQWLHWQNAHLQQAIGKVALERYYKPTFNMGAADPAKLEEGLKEVDRFCTVLNGCLANRDFICDKLTVADFALAGSFTLRQQLQLDLGKWTNLSRWLERIEARPAWVHGDA